VDLGAALRDRRKAAGRTIASVAVDAGLSVPYIANLENGRGNPTVSALDRLATALGAQLQLSISDEEPPHRADLAALVADSERAQSVIRKTAQGRSRRAVQQGLVATLEALADVLPAEPGEADLQRLLDLVVLSGE
jgi:transcriptional regulator with XRE-family HTH domain